MSHHFHGTHHEKNHTNSFENIDQIFFKEIKSDELINNIQSRLYGILSSTSQQRNIAKIKNAATRNKNIEKIIHKKLNLSHALAYQSGSGTRWQKLDLEHMGKNMLARLTGGNSLEILLTESLMRNPKKWYHFLPNKELDRDYKIDVFSRIPTLNKKSLGFGMQVTMAPINTDIPITQKNTKKSPEKEKRNRYHEKWADMQKMAQYFSESENRKDFLQKFDRLQTPDVIGYTAVNGKIQQTIGNGNDHIAFDYFSKWKNNNFQESGLIDFFDQDFQENIKQISRSIADSQAFLVSAEFFKKLKHAQEQQKWFSTKKDINEDFKETYTYSYHENFFTTTLRYKGEIIAKTTYFLNNFIYETLEEIHKNS